MSFMDLIRGKTSDLILPHDLSTAKPTALGIAGAAAAVVATGAAALLLPGGAAANAGRGARAAFGALQAGTRGREEALATNERNRLTRQQLGLRFLQRAKDKGGAKSDLLCKMARSQAALQHFNAAMRSAVEAVEADPKNSQAYLILGYLQFKASAFDEAMKSYKNALQYAPGRYEIAESMAICYERLGLDDDAHAAWQAGAKLDGQQLRPWMKQAEYYETRQSHREAKECFLTAFAINSSVELPWKTLVAKGRDALASGRIEDARHLFSDSLRYDSQMIEPIIGQAKCDLHEAKVQDALRLLLTAHQLKEDNVEVNVLVGNLYAKTDRKAEANKHWSLAFTKDFDAPVPWVLECNQGSLAMSQSKFHVAVGHFEAALERLPSWPRAEVLLVAAQKRRDAQKLTLDAEGEAKVGNMAAAEELWKAALNLDEVIPTAHLNLGALNADRGDTAEALIHSLKLCDKGIRRLLRRWRYVVPITILTRKLGRREVSQSAQPLIIVRSVVWFAAFGT